MEINAFRVGVTYVKSNSWFRICMSLIGVVLLWLYLFEYGYHIGSWDKADLVRGLLQASDMAKGNVLLDHWYSSTDSFWTIDDIFFVIGVMIVGAKILLLHVVSACTWTILIIAGAYVASLDLRRHARTTSALTVLVLLGVPSTVLAGYLSQSEIHIGTVVFALLAFLGLRDGRFGPGWFVAVALFALGTLGDPLIIAFGLVPALAVGLFDGIRARNWKCGFSTASAPIVATFIAGLARLAAVQIGTFQIAGSNPFAPMKLFSNLHLVIPGAATLLGLGHDFASNGVPWELELFRTTSALAVVTGVLAGTGCLLLRVFSAQPRIDAQGMKGRSEASYRLNDLLVLGVMGSVVAFEILSVDTSSTRYLIPGIVFGSILAAMLLGRLAHQLRTRRGVRALGAVGILLIGGFGAIAGLSMAQPISVSPFVQLSQFLKSHDLNRGVGDYWSSAPITVYSDGLVKVRQVTPTFGGGIEPYLWLSKSDWYAGTFQFLVYNAGSTTGKSIQNALQFPFSVVAHTYRDGLFRIVVWSHPEPISKLETG